MNTQMTYLSWIFSSLLPLTGFSRLQVKTKRFVLWCWYEKVLIVLAHILHSLLNRDLSDWTISSWWRKYSLLNRAYKHHSPLIQFLCTYNLTHAKGYGHKEMEPMQEIVVLTKSRLVAMSLGPTAAPYTHTRACLSENHRFLLALNTWRSKAVKVPESAEWKLFPLNSFQTWRTSRKLSAVQKLMRDSNMGCLQCL